MGPEEIKNTAEILSGDTPLIAPVKLRATDEATAPDEPKPTANEPEANPAPEDTAKQDNQGTGESGKEEGDGDRKGTTVPDPSVQIPDAPGAAEGKSGSANTESPFASTQDGESGEEAPYSHRGILYMLLGILLAAIAFLAWQRFLRPQTKQPPGEPSAVLRETTQQTAEPVGYATVSGNTVPETIKQTEPKTEKTQTTPQTEKKKQTEARPREEGSEVERVVFGDRPNSAGLSTIKVTGLTDADRSNTNFKEAAFVKSAAAFLADNNISVNTISFFGKSSSSGRSFSYQARLGSNTDHVLMVTMYPALPGEYIFNLVSLKDIRNQFKAPETQPQTSAQPQAAAQTAAQPQTAAPAVQQQTPNETLPSNSNSYDASSFYISNIPSTLSNYMSNPDILQYRLYDYLYQSGLRNTTGASIAGYGIDDDARTATIDIALNGGGSVRCYYDKESNQYSFQ